MADSEERDLTAQNPANQNNNKNEAAANLRKFGSVIFLLLQIFTILMFAFGMVNVFGDDFTLFQPIRALMNLTEFSRARAYELIIGFELSVVYVAVLIYMFYNFVQFLKRKRAKNFSPTESVTKAFFSSLIFVAAACAFTEVKFTFAGVLVFIITPVCNIVYKWFMFFARSKTRNQDKKTDIVHTIFDCISYSCVFVILCLFTAIFSHHPVVEEFISGWNVMIKGFAPHSFADILYFAFNSFLEPILCVILLIIVYKMFTNLLFSSKQMYRIKAEIKHGLIMTVVILVIYFIINGLLAVGVSEISADSIGLWWNAVKLTYFPIMLLFICLLLVLNLDGKY